MLGNKSIKLRILWIIPNVFYYLMFIGSAVFVFVNLDGLKEINRLGMWLFLLFVLLIMALIGSYRIWNWIKQGKM